MVPHIPIARRIDRTGACCHPLRCSSSSEPSPSIVPPPLNPRAIAPRCPLNRLRTRSRHLTQPIARLVCPLPRNDPANLSSTPKGCTETRVAWEADHKAVFGSSMYIRCVQWCPLTRDITDGLCTQSTRRSLHYTAVGCESPLRLRDPRLRPPPGTATYRPSLTTAYGAIGRSTTRSCLRRQTWTRVVSSEGHSISVHLFN